MSPQHPIPPALPSLHELVEIRPGLYDALRARDSAANRVCEILTRGGRPKQSLAEWRKAVADSHKEFAAAVEAYNAH